MFETRRIHRATRNPGSGGRFVKFRAVRKRDIHWTYISARNQYIAVGQQCRRLARTSRGHHTNRRPSASCGIVNLGTGKDRTGRKVNRIVDTSSYNVHQLRSYIQQKFERGDTAGNLLISLISFGYKNGVPQEADLVFDVRFLPNPHFVPALRPLTGRHPKVAAYVRQFPQTGEFLERITQLLHFLLPHYIKEGKSNLTVAFGCTGGQHRSVMVAEEVRKRLAREGYEVKSVHRDMPH